MRLWLPQVIVRPLVSVSVLPSASEVTADALAPFWATESSRLAASNGEAVVVVPFDNVPTTLKCIALL